MALVVKEMQCPSLDQEDPLEEGRKATPVFLPRESNGQRKLVGSEELDMTEET